jgi:hypothetical protein
MTGRPLLRKSVTIGDQVVELVSRDGSTWATTIRDLSQCRRRAAALAVGRDPSWRLRVRRREGGGRLRIR